MKTFQLEGKTREIAARPADQKRALKAMRKNDEIPAVLYGGEEVIHFTVTNAAVRNLVYTPDIYAVELNIDGNKKMVVMKDIQFHPVSDAILDTPHRLADARTRQLLIALHLSPRHQAEFGANESADTGESRQENPQQRTDIPKIHGPLLGWLVDRCRFATFLPDQSSHPRGEKPIEPRSSCFSSKSIEVVSQLFVVVGKVAVYRAG